MPGRDFSAELFGDQQAPQASAGGGRDFSAELFGSSPAKVKQPASTLERVMAVPAGINKAATLLAGMPVDAIANVLDLGKAGIGAAYQAVSGKTAPDWTLPSDRSQVVGSSDWIGKKLNQAASAVGGRSPVDIPRPDDKLSRVLYSGGVFAGSSLNPNPAARVSGTEQLMAAAGGAMGGLASGVTAEVAPEWAGLAGMLPQAAGAAAAGATRAAVRGGEKGRQAMAQRIQDLKNGGVDSPSVGLASGNKTLMGAENLLAQTPFSSGLYEEAGKANLAGMKGKTDALRDSISTDFGPVAAGSAIQSDLKGAFKDRIGDTYSTLNDRVERAVGPNAVVPVDQTILRSGQLSTPVPGAEATSSNFLQPRIAKINRDLLADSGGKPAQVINSLILGPDGLPATQTTIPAVQPQGIPFSALKDLRTKIGKEAASNAIMGTPEQADFKQLYGAMSRDMQNGVALADLRNGVQPAAAGSASTAFDRANTFYSRAMTRADDLNGLANRDTPEGAYNAVAHSLNSGPSLYEKLRGTIDPATRKKLVATIVDDLGTARAGQQNAAGDAWSPRTFLTNYAKLHENGGGDALFKRLPGGQKHADQLADIAKAAEMVGDASKVWANPSGTAAALTAKQTFFSLGAAALLHPLVAAGTAGSLAVANQTSKRLLLNPKFVGWLAEAPKLSPAKLQTSLQRLNANAKLWGDKQFQQDVSEYTNAVQQQAGQ